MLVQEKSPPLQDEVGPMKLKANEMYYSCISKQTGYIIYDTFYVLLKINKVGMPTIN